MTSSILFPGIETNIVYNEVSGFPLWEKTRITISNTIENLQSRIKVTPGDWFSPNVSIQITKMETTEMNSKIRQSSSANIRLHHSGDDIKLHRVPIQLSIRQLAVPQYIVHLDPVDVYQEFDTLFQSIKKIYNLNKLEGNDNEGLSVMYHNLLQYKEDMENDIRDRMKVSINKN